MDRRGYGMLATLVILIAANFALSVFALKRLGPDTPIPVEWGSAGKPNRFAPARNALFYLPLASCAVLLCHILTPGGRNAFPLSVGIVLMVLIGNGMLIRHALGHPPRLWLWVPALVSVALGAVAVQIAFLGPQH